MTAEPILLSLYHHTSFANDNIAVSTIPGCKLEIRHLPKQIRKITQDSCLNFREFFLNPFAITRKKREPLKIFENYSLIDAVTNLSKDLPGPAHMARKFKSHKDQR